jgi:hypothetical protein
MSSLIFKDQSSSPAAAGSAKHQLYAKADGRLYKQTGSAAEKELGGKILQVMTAGAGGPSTASGMMASVSTTTTGWVTLVSITMTVQEGSSVHMTGSTDIDLDNANNYTGGIWFYFAMLDVSDNVLKQCIPFSGGQVQRHNTQASMEFRTQALTAGTYTYKLSVKRPTALVNSGYIGTILLGEDDGLSEVGGAQGGPIFTLTEIQA